MRSYKKGEREKQTDGATGAEVGCRRKIHLSNTTVHPSPTLAGVLSVRHDEKTRMDKLRDKRKNIVKNFTEINEYVGQKKCIYIPLPFYQYKGKNLVFVDARFDTRTRGLIAIVRFVSRFYNHKCRIKVIEEAARIRYRRDK